MFRGEHHDCQSLGQLGLADFLHNLKAVQIRHSTIEECEFVRASGLGCPTQCREGGGSIRYVSDLRSPCGQGFLKDQAVRRMVVDDECSEPSKIDRQGEIGEWVLRLDAQLNAAVERSAMTF